MSVAEHLLPVLATGLGAVLWIATAIADNRAQRRLADARRTHDASLRRWLANHRQP